jgi:hypothetical protein
MSIFTLSLRQTPTFLSHNIQCSVLDDDVQELLEP